MADRTISKAALEAGVGVETIRYYERIGLLEKPKAPQEGWRQYHQDAVQVVKYIKAAQQLGFSLSEIRGLRKLTEHEKAPEFCRSIRNRAKEKIAAVDEQISNLTQVKVDLEAFLRRCALKPDEERCPIAMAFRAMKRGNSH